MSPPTAHDLTVVVPTRDRPEMLHRCLAALARLEPAPAAVIVVDSASARPDSVAAAVAAYGFDLVRCDRAGASRARNAGWRAAATPIVAFVDDDVRVRPPWAARLVAPFADPSVVLVTGAVVAGPRLDGASAAGDGDGDGPVGPIDGSVAVTDDVPAGRFTAHTPGNVGASANLAVRRATLDAIGGFDELLGAGGRFRAAEDLDLFDRALVTGDGWHAADAEGVHEQWRTRRQRLALDVSYGYGTGARFAKLARLNRDRAGLLARYESRRFVTDVVESIRAGYEYGLLSRVVWIAALAAGVVRAVVVPIRRQHLVADRRR